MANSNYSKYLKRYEKQTGEKIAVSAFNQSIDFVSDYRPEYDVIFLDIEMPLLNGLQSAKKGIGSNQWRTG